MTYDAVLDLFQAWLLARVALYHESSSDYQRSAELLHDEAAERAADIGISLDDVYMDFLHHDLRGK